jgi:hypothetical protein
MPDAAPGSPEGASAPIRPVRPARAPGVQPVSLTDAARVGGCRRRRWHRLAGQANVIVDRTAACQAQAADASGTRRSLGMVGPARWAIICQEGSGRRGVAGNGRAPEPVCGRSPVDKRPKSVDNPGLMWTSGPRSTDNRYPRRGRSDDPRARPGRPPELSTVRSTVTTPERRPLSTVTSQSSTGAARTATRGRPPGPHHDDGDDGTKIRGRYPRTMHLGARSRSRPAHWPEPSPLE